MTMRVLSKYICHYLMKLAMLLCEEYFASEDITELHVFHRNNMYTKLYFSLRKKNNFHLIFQVLLFCFRNISPGYYHIKCMQVHVDQKLIHLMKFHLYAQSLFSKKKEIRYLFCHYMLGSSYAQSIERVYISNICNVRQSY